MGSIKQFLVELKIHRRKNNWTIKIYDNNGP